MYTKPTIMNKSIFLYTKGTCDLCGPQEEGYCNGITLDYGENRRKFICNNCVRFIGLNCYDAVVDIEVAIQDFSDMKFKSVID
jgi:transcription elongation factor Elf1